MMVSNSNDSEFGTIIFVFFMDSSKCWANDLHVNDYNVGDTHDL